MATFNGTDGNDTLVGTAADDIFRPGLGYDYVSGGGGFDSLFVDYSSNVQFDQSTELTVVAGEIRGELLGRYPQDRVQFNGIQHLEAVLGGRNDGFSLNVNNSGATPFNLTTDLVIDGGAGFNSLGLNFANYGFGVSITATSGTLTTSFGTFRNFQRFDLYGSAFADTLIGDASNNTLRGDAGNDRLEGNGGDDYIEGGTGVDTLLGGDGNDYFKIASLEAGEIINGGAGIDTVYFSTENATTGINIDLGQLLGGGTVVIAGATLSGIEQLAGIEGSRFDDRIILGTSVNQLTVTRLGDGNDSLVGGSGRDEVYGDAGNDTIDGALGNDRLFGGQGNDSLLGGNGDDEIGGGDGNDTLLGGDGNDVLSGDAGDDSVAGGIGDDTLYGGPGSDTLDGGEGNDQIFGYLGYFGGSDPGARQRLIGGNGNDVVVGGYGDTIEGGAGTDIVFLDLSAAPAGVTINLAALVSGGTIALGSGSVSGFEAYGGIYATEFDDVITLGEVVPNSPIYYGLEGVQAGGGNDSITGGTRDDQLFGAAGNDTLIGLSGNDYLAGGDGDDSLSGGDGNDSIAAGSGDDRADGAAGDDTIQGGSGNDTITAGEGVNRVQGEDGDDVITAGAGADNLDGGTGNDSIDGGAGDDTLFGGQGVDTLRGGDGNDLLQDDGPGDLLFGGAGNDRYFVSSAATLIFEDASRGFDEVITTVSSYLFANLESLTLQNGAGDLFGVGNDLANVITGNEGANLLIGGAGADTISGGAGNDLLFGESGNDSIEGGAGIDYIVGGAGNDVLSGGQDADAIYGEDGNDTLIGGFGFSTDILVGGAGNDVLFGDFGGLGDYDILNGGDGDDIYWVDTPADLTFEADGGGIDTVHAGIAGAGYYLYPFTENLILEGYTPFGVGNELNNVLTGSFASNVLLGGAGNDTLNGKGDSDLLFGESGADTFVFERGTGGDVIGDFQTGIDKIQLTGLGFGSFAALQAAFVEVGGTTAINLGQGDFVVVLGVANTALTAADFILG